MVSHLEKLEKQLAEIEPLIYEEPREAIRRLDLLRSSLDQEAGSEISASLFFSLGRAYFEVADSRHSMENLQLATEYASRLEDRSILAECYNLYGTAFSMQGNYAKAIEYYDEALEIGQEDDQAMLQIKANVNLGQICFITQEYERAEDYLKQALALAMKDPQAPSYDFIFYSVKIEMALNALESGHLEEADAILEELAPLMEEYPDFKDLPYTALAFMRWAYFHGDTQEELKWRRIGLDYFYNGGDFGSYVEEAADFMEHLALVEDQDNMERFNDLLTKALSATDYYGKLLELSGFRMDWYRQRREMALELNEARLFLEYASKQKEVAAETSMSFLESQAILRQAMADTEKFAEFAEMDELTRIPNRRSLTRSLYSCLDLARKGQTPLGVEILDIDHFKEINDTYGHAVGDACLALLAQVLVQVVGEKGYYARYGGDEFVIIWPEAQEETVKAKAHSLKKLLTAWISQEETPAFTVSQGICCRVPDEKSRPWDFTGMADKALYYVKEHGRDGIAVWPDCIM